MGSRERRRGAQAERELAAILADSLGVTVKRKLGQARDSGDDIQIGRLRIEVKRCERLAIPAWTRQVEAAAGAGDVPIVAYRQDGEPWRVVLRLDDVLPWLREEVGNA